MSAVLERADPMAELSRAHAALGVLHDLDFTGLSDDALLGFWRELERLRRRLPLVEHQLVLEAEDGGLPETNQLRGAAQLMRALLRLDPGEANGRVRAAHATGTRRAMTGEPLPRLFAQVAAAQADGSISERQARVVCETIDELPEQIREPYSETIEAELVGYAHQFDPIPLGKLAERITYCYDPDGRLEDVEHRARQRELTLRQRVDGSAKLTGELTAEATELLLLHLDALARPRPAADAVKDPRSAGQRRHDALLEALKVNVRARQLPNVAGVTATIVLTMTAQTYRTGRGLARTGHSALVPATEAMRWAAADFRLMNVVLDQTKAIAGYSSIHRLFTEQQRLALQAIDGGCTFPNCPIPIDWCQIDHTTDHAKGGPTRVDHGVLACQYHNVEAKEVGAPPGSTAAPPGSPEVDRPAAETPLQPPAPRRTAVSAMTAGEWPLLPGLHLAVHAMDLSTRWTCPRDGPVHAMDWSVR